MKKIAKIVAMNISSINPDIFFESYKYNRQWTRIMKSIFMESCRYIPTKIEKLDRDYNVNAFDRIYIGTNKCKIINAKCNYKNKNTAIDIESIQKEVHRMVYSKYDLEVLTIYVLYSDREERERNAIKLIEDSIRDLSEYNRNKEILIMIGNYGSGDYNSCGFKYYEYIDGRLNIINV